jgi:hypothetical protein
VPKPTIVSSVPGDHSEPPAAPTTFAGVFVDALESSSSVMS